MSTADEETKRSWNLATRNHNSHKGDQAALLRAGQDVLFPEELELLGELTGKSLVHLQCNAGQDTLGLARRGARVLGVDFSDEAIGFARKLAQQAGLAAEFVESELLEWMHSTPRRFERAFSSYGAVGWIRDLEKWAHGVARVLEPGGRFVYVEFHPLAYSVGPSLALDADDYFSQDPFVAPVTDYVAESGAGLGAVARGEAVENTFPATSWQHGMAQVVDALLRAGMRLETLREYPYANGCRVHPKLVPVEGRRYVWPEGTARVPLMFGLSVSSR